ncbi:MAG: hypothetical protein CL581_18250 [Alteromonadaceae bacterium]|nr:hypothetical protein [Alteromonadaceae bacterium]
MAVGDFGGGLLAGLQGAQAFAQQRRDNQFREDELQLARDKQAENIRQFNEALKVDQQNADTSRMNAETNQGTLAIAQAQEERTARDDARAQDTQRAGDYYIRAGNLGYVSTENATKLDEGVLAAGLAAGDRNADQFAIDVLENGFLPRPDGFTYTEIRRDENGGISVVGQYEDGSMGVLTERGTIEASDNVIVLTPEQAAKAISDEWVNYRVLDGAQGTAGATYMAQMGVNDADIRAANDAADAQAIVTTTIDAQGDPAASRSFRNVLAAAETEEEKQNLIRQTAKDLGIAIPDTFDDTTRFSGRVKTLQDAITRLTNRKARLNQGAPLGAQIDREVAKYQEELAELQQQEADIRTARGNNTRFAGRTPVMDTDAWNDFEQSVITRVDGLSPEELDALVDSGELRLTSSQISAMGQRMQEAGVEKISDITKLPTREQLAARALLSVVAPDEKARERARAEMSNLKSTGRADVSQSDLDKQATDRIEADARAVSAAASLQNAQTNFRKYVEGIDKDGNTRLYRAGQIAVQALDSMTSRFQDPDRPDKPNKNWKSALVGFNNDLSKIQVQSAQFQNDPQAMALINESINAGLSTAIATFVQFGPSAGFGARLKSFFVDDANPQGTDFDLSRVRVNDPENPTEFIYLSYATDADGNRTGEQQGKRVKISDFEKLGKRLSDRVKQAAIANTQNG